MSFWFHCVSLRNVNYLWVYKDIGEVTMLWQLLHYQQKMVQLGWWLRVVITRFIGDGACRRLMDNGLVSPPLNESRNCWYCFLLSMYSFISYSSMYGKTAKLFSEHISRDSLQHWKSMMIHRNTYYGVELMAGVGNLFDMKYHLEFFLLITVPHDLFH